MHAHRFELPPLYGITNVETAADPLDFTERLLRAGVKLIQLRAKKSSRREFVDLSRAVISLRNKLQPDAASRSAIIINDEPEICLETGADGIHVGQEDPSPVEARRLLGKTALIGLSTTELAHIASAPAAVLDYLAFGPVFTSPTKQGVEAGLEQLARAAAASPLPLVAIGGITAERAREVFRAGAASAAVISDLEQATDIPARIAAYSAAFEDVRRPRHRP